MQLIPSGNSPSKESCRHLDWRRSHLEGAEAFNEEDRTIRRLQGTRQQANDLSQELPDKRRWRVSLIEVGVVKCMV